MSGKRVIGGRRLEQAGNDMPRRRAPVFVYLAVLFVAAFLMLLLAYFIQVRNDSVESPVPLETQSLFAPAPVKDRIFAIIP